MKTEELKKLIEIAKELKLNELPCYIKSHWITKEEARKKYDCEIPNSVKHGTL